MKFKKIDSGTIFDVTNPKLIHSYEENKTFEKVEDKKPEKKGTKK